MKLFYNFIIFLSLFFYISLSYSQERLGIAELEELNLKPRIKVYEPQGGGFEIGESTVTLSYLLEPYLKAYLTLGDQSLLNQPSYFYNASEAVKKNLTMIEGYALVRGAFGQFRLGLLPLNLTFLGESSESQIVLPRSMIYTQKVAALRDLGLSYEIKDGFFFSRIVLHNGEAGENADGRIWMTGKWGYKNPYFQGGLFGQVGETTAASTGDSIESRANFDGSLNTKTRLGGCYLESKGRHMRGYLEYYFGEIDRDKKTQGQFAGGLLGADFMFYNNWSFHIRSEVYDPIKAIEKNKLMETMLGISWSSEYLNSVVSLVAIKKEEDAESLSNDELLLTWKLSP